MPDGIANQMFAKTADNIQKLFELCTRFDERIKIINDKQDYLDKKINDVFEQYIILMQKSAVLQSHNDDDDSNVSDIQKSLNEIDKRLSKMENSVISTNDRWNKIGNFFIQLIWVVLAAYLLTKLNLQAPAVP